MNKMVSMTAQALRSIMGEAFDYDEYEKGRRDCRDLARKVTHKEFSEKLEEVKSIISRGEFRRRPGPSYWIGCLCEFDFVVWPKDEEEGSGDD